MKERSQMELVLELGKEGEDEDEVRFLKAFESEMGGYICRGLLR